LINRNDDRIIEILKRCDFLIDGRYEDSLRDITIPLRGSTNQNIIELNSLDLI